MKPFRGAFPFFLRQQAVGVRQGGEAPCQPPFEKTLPRNVFRLGDARGIILVSSQHGYLTLSCQVRSATK